jgi:sucrose-phosphate synthase
MSEQKLRILMISLHGLIRGKDLELGRDSDTGGQITYVLELAKALGRHPDVAQIDLLTRQVEDAQLSDDYMQPEEQLADNVRIVRLPFGPKRYLRKELLWPHLDPLIDRCLHMLRQQGQLPDLIHTHYADAGHVGHQLSNLLGIPQIHTGHSLGRPKRERMLASGRKEQAIERQFNMSRRIAVEEEVLAHAAMIITSTRQEIDEQYGIYQNHTPGKYHVIPPGTDISRFHPPGRRKIDPGMTAMVNQHLSDPDKPIILAICRPDTRKNIHGLIKAYGESQELQQRANLVLVAGTRDDIREMEEESQRQVLRDLLLDLDKYDLWGKVSIPKHCLSEDVPELYRLAVRRRGVFVNPALTEPFGLTLIEAAASGLPFVATEDGGPRDILANCHNGLLVDPLDSDAIAQALITALSDAKQWSKWSKNGIASVKRHYSWDAHVHKYIKLVKGLLHRERKRMRRQLAFSLHGGVKSSIPTAQKAIISDIDNTLIGDDHGLKQLIEVLRVNAHNVVFGVATGRPLESTIKVLRKYNVPIPDILITSVGTEINYWPSGKPDRGWIHHISHKWRREALQEFMSTLPGLRPQTQENQREFKLSYCVDLDRMPSIKEISRLLRQHRLEANLIYSHGEFLDVLPIRASKGQAIRFLAYKWGLPLEQFLVAGDSGNDEEMLVGDTLGVVVGNHSSELEPLRGLEQIYFADGDCAQGILEGIDHYEFLAKELLQPKPGAKPVSA